MRCCALGSLFVFLCGLVGCTGKTTPNTSDASASGQTPAAAQATPRTQPIAVPASATPDQVVSTFLNALRTGDSPTTESLLTTKAREELAKHSLSVDVVSAPNSTYQVRPGEVLPNDPAGAHVSSVWTEKFADGEETYEIIWALRRQTEGWRLAGMAMELIPGQQMQFLNFENPEDMLRKKDEAIAAMQPAAAETAQQTQPAPTAQRPAIER
jgi:hypothetical protein